MNKIELFSYEDIKKETELEKKLKIKRELRQKVNSLQKALKMILEITQIKIDNNIENLYDKLDDIEVIATEGFLLLKNYQKEIKDKKTITKEEILNFKDKYLD